MKSKNPYRVFPNYCLRVPSQPYYLYKKLTESNQIEAIEFEKLLKNKTFIKALELASPDLLKQFILWSEGKVKDTKKIERLKYAVLKYFTRITTRSTPFGFFASCSMGHFANETSISLKPIETYRTFSRLDMGFLSSLIDKVSQHSGIKHKINYYPNSSLYRIGNQYRFTSYTYENNRRIYHLDGAFYSEYLEIIINKSRKGQTTEALINTLIELDINKEDANVFVNELILKQILVSELQLDITSSNNLLSLIQKLKNLSIEDGIIEPLEEINKRVTGLDESSIIFYTKLFEWIEKKYPETNSYKKNVLQVDVFSQTNSNQLAKKHIKAIKACMSLFNKITIQRKNKRLEQFKNSFLKRYESKELPLMEVLDSEFGIGYGVQRDENTPLLDDLLLPSKKRTQIKIDWSKVDDILIKKIEYCIHKNQYSLELTDDDFKEFDLNWNDLPDTMSSIVEVISIKGRETLIMEGIGGSSAANLLARFSHGNKSILKQVKYITDCEKEIKNDSILAEIIHIPQSRTGNILRRPSVRDYELPFLGTSSLPYENQIDLNDVLVSVSNDKITLRSKRLNKEVLPRLTNAHNYSNGLPIYLFLCDLQNQNNRSYIGFGWHKIFDNFSFLPRVTYKSVIVSKAKWNIKISLISDFFHLPNSKLINEIKLWRKSLNMPNLVQLIDGDNLLLIKMSNVTCLKMLFSIIKNYKAFKLVEFIEDEKGIVSNNDDSIFRNEFVVSVYNANQLEKNNIGITS